MAKKDKKDQQDEEYNKENENIDNTADQDDEDFGLPDLEEDDNSDSSDEEETFENTTTEDAQHDQQEEAATFDTSETSDTTDEYVTTEEEYEEDSSEVPPSTYVAPKKQSAAPIIITLIIVFLLVIVAVWFFFIKDPSKKEEANKAPVKDTTEVVKQEKPVKVEEPEITEPEPEEEIVATVNTLNSRTGRSYVVVGSFFDDDLAKDFANELVSEGTNAYIIPPFGKSKFNRVAIEETESFSKASKRAAELKGEFEEDPWPLKY